MSKESIKSKFPFAYQEYLYVKDIFKVRKNKKEAKKIHSMSDEELRAYDAKLYELRHNKSLNWNNLLTYNEKMQWAKLYDKDSRKVICADKYAVREWVAKRIGEEYLIPLVGVWEKFSDVDFKKLPEQFVIKTNHGSGDVVVVRSKSKMTLSEKLAMRRKINVSMKTDYGTQHCELHYSDIPPKVIAEEFIDSKGGDLQDYKFLCFNGVPHFCWVDVDRFTNHKRNIYDLDWNLQDWNQRNYGNSKMPVEKPKNFDEMIEIAKKLSEGFSHVRIDLYNVDGKIYFGEMTFTNGSGFETIHPESADLMLGNLWDIT